MNKKNEYVEERELSKTNADNNIRSRDRRQEDNLTHQKQQRNPQKPRNMPPSPQEPTLFRAPGECGMVFPF